MRHVLQFDPRVTFKSKTPDVQLLSADHVRYLRYHHHHYHHMCAFLAADVGQFWGGLWCHVNRRQQHSEKDGFHNAHARTACTSEGSCSVVFTCIHMGKQHIWGYCNITWSRAAMSTFIVLMKDSKKYKQSVSCCCCCCCSLEAHARPLRQDSKDKTKAGFCFGGRNQTTV